MTLISTMPAWEWLLISALLISCLGLLLHHRTTRQQSTRQEELTQLKEWLLQQIHSNQNESHQSLSQQVSNLANQVQTGLNQQLSQNSGHIHQSITQFKNTLDKQLGDSLQQSQKTFHDVLQRLTIIDQAQNKLQQLSTQVVDLQQLLSNKQKRGYLGEVQLMQILQDSLPESCYKVQHTLSNNKRVDCLLMLPSPTEPLAIDAKFPLENYQEIQKHITDATKHQQAKQKFEKDLKSHIDAISQKYIIPGETAKHAVMFIPSEAIFTEICAHHLAILQYANKHHVWIASPTNLMALLHIAHSVIKDHVQSQQTTLIQNHLKLLETDFIRFQKRLGLLATHIKKSQEDVDGISISAQKIINRFAQIGQVNIDDDS